MYETVLERLPRRVFKEFYGILKYDRNFPRSTHICSYVGERKPGTRMKAQASCSNKELEEGQEQEE